VAREEERQPRPEHNARGEGIGDGHE
jgi:hypothetical protein